MPKDHIIRLAFYVAQPPQLFLEYMLYGALDDQKAISQPECVDILQ